jgi:UDP-N-acetylmuramoylalanine--D-glutamate ligase
MALELQPVTVAGIPLIHCADLEDAVHRAGAAAVASEPPGVVLLSPACASFDAFANYEERGERFRQIVEVLS